MDKECEDGVIEAEHGACHKDTVAVLDTGVPGGSARQNSSNNDYSHLCPTSPMIPIDPALVDMVPAKTPVETLPQGPSLGVMSQSRPIPGTLQPDTHENSSSRWTNMTECGGFFFPSTPSVVSPTSLPLPDLLTYPSRASHPSSTAPPGNIFETLQNTQPSPISPHIIELHEIGVLPDSFRVVEPTPASLPDNSSGIPHSIPPSMTPAHVTEPCSSGMPSYMPTITPSSPDHSIQVSQGEQSDIPIPTPSDVPPCSPMLPETRPAIKPPAKPRPKGKALVRKKRSMRLKHMKADFTDVESSDELDPASDGAPSSTPSKGPDCSQNHSTKKVIDGQNKGKTPSKQAKRTSTRNLPKEPPSLTLAEGRTRRAPVKKLNVDGTEVVLPVKGTLAVSGGRKRNGAEPLQRDVRKRPRRT
ncbi:hypothetical protein BDZ94DRAFT_1268674 [Collybia nuda]|uniref:Uncharacterized protein n=1 Tax=Collybia nuda TaxID=64659 RepID=A0A9P6CFS3_9AGAR|nr:hypothetical protein BDZ94DRAFT_1268674 [Collybia nuda]